jgi:hypothetical protein
MIRVKTLDKWLRVGDVVCVVDDNLVEKYKGQEETQPIGIVSEIIRNEKVLQVNVYTNGEVVDILPIVNTKAGDTLYWHEELCDISKIKIANIGSSGYCIYSLGTLLSKTNLLINIEFCFVL